MIDATFDLLQTADSRSCPESLAYYHEREWRIAPVFSSGVRCRRMRTETATGETDLPSWVRELRARLRALDSDFFSEQVLDECAILDETRDRTFFVEEIVCPTEAAASVADLLGSDADLVRIGRRNGPAVFVRSR